MPKCVTPMKYHRDNGITFLWIMGITVMYRFDAGFHVSIGFGKPWRVPPDCW